MSNLTPAEAWQRIVGYASRNDATVSTVADNVTNTLSYDAEQNVVSLESQHYNASGESFEIERETFITLWEHLQKGVVLSRDNEGEYTSLPALLDGQYRASGVMGLLNTVFDEIAADTRPVRIWLDE